MSKQTLKVGTFQRILNGPLTMTFSNMYVQLGAPQTLTCSPPETITNYHVM